MGPDAGTAALDAPRPLTAPGLGSGTRASTTVTATTSLLAPPLDDELLELPPPLGASRYRALRGKSVTSLRRKAFEVFHDDNSSTTEKRSSKAGGGISLAELYLSSLRSRSTSLSAARSSTAGFPGLGLSSVHQIPSDIPPLPTLPLPPLKQRPVNVPTLNTNKPVGCVAPAPGPAVTHSVFDHDDDQDEEVRPPAPLKTPSSKSLFNRRPLPTVNRAVVANKDDRHDDSDAPTPPKSPSSTGPCTPDESPDESPEQAQAARWADEVARLEAETDRILAEQKKRDLVRLQAQLAATPTKTPNLKTGFFDKLVILSRGKKANAAVAVASQPGTPGSLASTVFSLDFARSSGSSFESAPSPGPMSSLEPGSKGILPQVDAPTTAVNGGDRRVTVRCLSSTISLPVTVDTSIVDILYSAANFMTQNFDPASSVVVECYMPLSLERRLRRYERARDVMNSWDRDAQNSLLILSQLGQHDSGSLDYGSVPRTQNAPPGFTVQIYHSSRPGGKWNKRYVTLLDSGQIFCSKKTDAKPSDKDSTVLCHLSDFDIYAPKESTIRRQLKAPGKFCHAIKSQQKTIVFPDGENFVHYFSTDDSGLSERFHDMVHAWRSWYLVNKKVDLQKKDKIDAPAHQASIKKSKSVVRHGNMRLKLSVDETPYMIGAFEPLIDMERFNKPIEEFGKDIIIDEKPIARQPSKKVQKPKVSTKPTTQPPPPPLPPVPKMDKEFSAGGLLGAGYDKRKQALDVSTGDSPKQQEGPFTGGASLLNNVASPRDQSPATPDSSSWFPSAEQHSARARSNTIRTQSARTSTRPVTADSAAHARRERTQQQPLINLADSFPEPPQWRESRTIGQPTNHSQGHGVRAPTGGPLINFATGGQTPNSTQYNDLGQRGLMRSNTRSSSQPTGQQSQLVSRPRSRSIAPSSQPSSRHPYKDETPPVPPLPNRSIRRAMTAGPSVGPSRGRESHPPEPLVNRAR